MGYKINPMKDIQNRLKRLEGQIRGLQKLLETSQDCEKIITQFQAAQGAFDTCFAIMLHKNLKTCLRTKESEKLEKILKVLAKKR